MPDIGSLCYKGHIGSLCYKGHFRVDLLKVFQISWAANSNKVLDNIDKLEVEFGCLQWFVLPFRYLFTFYYCLVLNSMGRYILLDHGMEHTADKENSYMVIEVFEGSCFVFVLKSVLD